MRGTCAMARVIMQLFDRKLMVRLQEMGVTIYDVMRYMDDSVTTLQECVEVGGGRDILL